jgi:hypothetical protein
LPVDHRYGSKRGQLCGRGERLDNAFRSKPGEQLGCSHAYREPAAHPHAAGPWGLPKKKSKPKKEEALISG